MRLASFDDRKLHTQQIWYDQLRGSDDGSFSKTSITNSALGTDPIDYIHRKEKMGQQIIDSEKKRKILQKWTTIDHKNSFMKQPSQVSRPFNSQSRASFGQ